MFVRFAEIPSWLWLAVLQSSRSQGRYWGRKTLDKNYMRLKQPMSTPPCSGHFFKIVLLRKHARDWRQWCCMPKCYIATWSGYAPKNSSCESRWILKLVKAANESLAQKDCFEFFQFDFVQYNVLYIIKWLLGIIYASIQVWMIRWEDLSHEMLDFNTSSSICRGMSYTGWSLWKLQFPQVNRETDT